MSIVGYALWLYHRFPLSQRDVQELLFERGITVSIVVNGLSVRTDSLEQA